MGRTDGASQMQLEQIQRGVHLARACKLRWVAVGGDAPPVYGATRAATVARLDAEPTLLRRVDELAAYLDE